MEFRVEIVGVYVEIIHNVRTVAIDDTFANRVVHLTFRHVESVFERRVVFLCRKACKIVLVVRLEIVRVVRKNLVEFLLRELSACLNRNVIEGIARLSFDVVPLDIRCHMAILAAA